MAEKKYIIDNPDLMAEWDWEKNNELELNPNSLTYASNKMAWWKCSHNHSWETAIATRGLKSHSCPYCSGNKVLEGFNDFQTKHPQLARCWDNSKNKSKASEVAVSSGKCVWWVCDDCGISFQRRVADMRRPYCVKCGRLHKKIDKQSSLGSLFPKIIEEWDYSKNARSPYEIKPHCNDKFYWNCATCGTPFYCSPDYRIRSNGGGCKECKKSTLSKLKQVPQEGLSFLEKYPNIVNTYYDFNSNNLDISAVSYKSNRKAKWTCKKCGISWIAKFQDMTEGRRCPRCETIKFKSFPEQCLFYYVSKYFKFAVWGDNSFKNKGLHELDIYLPKLAVAIEYDGEHWHQEIDQDLKKDQLCENLQLKLIRVREPSCPSYSSNSIKIYRKINHHGDNYQDLNQTIHSVLKAIDPTQFYEVNIENDLVDIYGISPHQKIANSFGETFPELARFWDSQKNGNVTPLQIPPKSDKIFFFLCRACGKSFKRRIASITRSTKSYCVNCSRKAAGISRSIAPPEKSIGQLYPTIAKELLNDKNMDIDIFDIYPSSQKKLWWKCSKCGKFYEMTPNNRINGHSCPKCALLSRASKRSKKVRNVGTGEIFQSITEASKVYKINSSCICAVCTGRQETAAGYKWEYIIEY